MNKMKNKIRLLIICFYSFQFSLGANPLNKTALEMEKDIAGGKTKYIRVKVIKNRFFLEGSVYKVSDKKLAGEVCRTYAANLINLKNSAFKSVDDLCVNLVKLADSLPPGPPQMLRVEYRVLYIPNTKISTGNILSENFFNSTDFPNDARLIKSVAFNLVDGAEFFPDSNAPPETSSSITSEKFNISTQENINGNYSLETTTKASSILGTAKIIVDADARIANTTSQFERRIKTKVVVTSGETAGLSSWINLDEKELKSPGFVILVRATHLRSASDSVPLENPVSASL